MKLPRKVKLVEVGPRDGLQNESRIISAEIKVEFINRLSETGLKVIEATSFVSPKWIPQLADSEFVLGHIKRKPKVEYPVLVPNKIGFENAIKAGAKEIAVFTAATETFCQKNTHCSLEESLNRSAEVIELAKKNKIKVRGYISCVMGCPYEGKVAVSQVVSIAEKLFEWGCCEISLGDTIGVGTPKQAQLVIDSVAKKIPRKYLAAHFHDTYGQALANLFAVMERGISVIDSSVSGLGGCPYAKGASGNVATEDVLYMLNGLGIETGVDLDKLLKTGKFISEQLNRVPRSKLGQAKML
ncbi:MAG TPA: hydroxymethylglutaryl-CoA lyase [Gammaproteobacteria bacterium]|nr:hydroxymethylglutaryl-CoA lyase [Gammaproteobacteria bacterium]